MHIVFFSHYFYPEGNAPATRVHALCRRWVQSGHRVTVITGVPNVPDGKIYSGYKNRWRQSEQIDGIEVRRVWTLVAANKGVVLRILNYLTYMCSAILSGISVEKPDMVIATTPQFFCGWAGVWVSALRRSKLILDVRDLWPASIAAVGAIESAWILRVLSWLERRMYRKASHIVTVGDGYQKELIQRGVPPENISIITNGVEAAWRPDSERVREIRARYAKDGAFLCGYVGTIGMACGLDVVVRAAMHFEKQGVENVRFLLVGEGALREALQAEVDAQGISSIDFTGRVDKRDVPNYIAALDASLIHLRKVPLFETVLPSKLYESLYYGKPVILGVQGEAANLLMRAGAGICIEPEDAEALCDAIIRLQSDPVTRSQMGEAAAAWGCQYDYDKLASSYEEVMRSVSGKI